jgi:2-polyprenyl-3-methyl-5-hydroxy-6-metoxy-1,4-benzoquinol methylase
MEAMGCFFDDKSTPVRKYCGGTFLIARNFPYGPSSSMCDLASQQDRLISRCFMLDDLQFRILKKIAPGDPQTMNGSSYEGKSKVGVYLGDDLVKLTLDKTVIDFGCRGGADSIDLARFGAKKVIGIDIRQSVLDIAKDKAAAAGGSLRVHDEHGHEGRRDHLSLDAFEHFDDPWGDS